MTCYVAFREVSRWEIATRNLLLPIIILFRRSVPRRNCLEINAEEKSNVICVFLTDVAHTWVAEGWTSSAGARGQGTSSSTNARRLQRAFRKVDLFGGALARSSILRGRQNAGPGSRKIAQAQKRIVLRCATFGSMFSRRS